MTIRDHAGVATQGVAVRPKATSALSADEIAALDGALLDGTTISTDAGWRPVETLRAGDWVLGGDGRFATLDAVERHTVWSVDGFPRDHWPLRFSPDVLDNRTAIFLLPDQLVQLERPRVLVEAWRLHGREGVEACAPGREISVTRLLFDRPRTILANYGVVLHCKGQRLPVLDTGAEAAPDAMVPMRDDMLKDL